MILAAGRGERLRPLTDKIPKPMIPISSEPLIIHQLRWLRRAGISQVIVNLHHLGDQIESAVGNGRMHGVRVEYSREDGLLDTGGGVLKALPMLGSEPFVVLNGDVWTNFPFASLRYIAGDQPHLVLIPKPENRESGDFKLEGHTVVRSSCLKDHTHVYCGICVLHESLFADVSDSVFSLRDVFFEQSRQRRLTGQVFDGNWFDIGSHDQLKAVRRHVLGTQSPREPR